ncbi:MAG: hypothetical protein ACRDL3_11485 [Solirubrobacterales bacterium]
MTSPVVAAAIEHWDRLLAEDESLEDRVPALREWMLERGLRIDDRPLCTVLRPHLVAEDDLAHDTHAAERVMSAIYKVHDALLENRELQLRHLDKFHDWIGDLLHLEKRPVVDGAVMRLDSSLARSRHHFIELNADMPQGMGHNDRVVDFFQRLDPYERFAERYRVRPLRLEETLLETLLAIWSEWGGRGKPTIGIVTRTDDPVRVSSLEIDREYCAERGIHAVIVEPGELSFEAGRLRHEDVEIDVVHRVIGTAECLAARDEVAPLLDAVGEGAVCMVNSFRSELLGHKAIFALLTDPGYDFGFNGAERTAIREHVPWTRQVFDGKTTDAHGNEVDLVEHVAENRERLVLKPTHDFGGHGMRLGWDESEESWRDAIANALDTDYIAQHRVELRREEYPTMDAPGAHTLYCEDTDPFLFRGRLGGLLTRLSPGELTNVHAEGSVVASFAIEPRD